MLCPSCQLAEQGGTLNPTPECCELRFLEATPSDTQITLFCTQGSLLAVPGDPIGSRESNPVSYMQGQCPPHCAMAPRALVWIEFSEACWTEGPHHAPQGWGVGCREGC